MRREVIRGELTTRAHALRRGFLFAGPGILWLALFLALPLALILLISFMTVDEYGRLVVTFTWDNFSRLAGYTSFGWTSDTIFIFLRTLWVAAITTVLSVVIAYPLAFYAASLGPQGRYLVLALITIPFGTNLVIRSYAWQTILAAPSPVCHALVAIGVLDPGTGLFPGPVAVYLGMVTACMPFAALPIYTSVERLDWKLVEAATDLHAGRWLTFRHAILPQTAPGLLTALILTFIPACGMFVVTDLLGGAKFMMIGNLLQQQLNRNWPFAACVSLALIAMTFVGLYLLKRWSRDELGH